MKTSSRKAWTTNEDRLLKKHIKQLGPKWLMIAKAIGHNRNASQCSQRWKRIREQVPRQARWNTSEDELLLKLVQKNMKWGEIKSYFATRTTAQIKKRYENVLHPNINRNPFSPSEDVQLWQLVQENGTKWTEISRQFIGRPENMIKNRYYFHIRQKQSQTEHPYYEKYCTRKRSNDEEKTQTDLGVIQLVNIDQNCSLLDIESDRLIDPESEVEEVDEQSNQYSSHLLFARFGKRASISE